jgi:glycosyltransferase involved in cell wall biosynthesis
VTDEALEGRAGRPVLIHRVIARLNVGGPAMHVVNLAGTMNTGPWRTRLVVGSLSADEGDMEYYAAERHVEVTHLGSLSREIDARGDLLTLAALYRLFRRERPDVVHTHTAKAGALGRLAAILAGVPVRVHTFHGHVLGGDYFSPRRTRLFLEIERQLARGTHRLVVLTRSQAREMAEGLGIAGAEKFAVVPLGLELEGFAGTDRPASRARTRRELGLAEETPAIGIVGRLVPIKNHELFLEAMAALGRRFPDATAVVIGSGEREARLRALTASLGLAERVRWLGWRRDLPGLYSALDVVALTSHDEGTPVALLEALAAGTPVVARDVGGVAEVLAATGEGRVLPATAGAGEWASALERELGRSPVPPEVRGAVAVRYSVGRLAGDLGALYRHELARAGGAGA